MTATRLLLAGILLLLPDVAALAADAPPPIVLAFGNKKAGAACLLDTDCDDNRCRLYPDGQHYCVAPGKACAAPASDGASPGKTNVHGVCYECVQGMGWQACQSAPTSNGPVRPLETRNK
jgi:hypothetical protein